MSASETKAWTKLYAPWTDHELEYGDDTLASIYDRNLELNADKPATYFSGAGKATKSLTNKFVQQQQDLRPSVFALATVSPLCSLTVHSTLRLSSLFKTRRDRG